MEDEKIQLIEDFSGGLNTRLSPNRLPANASPTSTNTWYDAQALSKRTGQTLNSTQATIGGGAYTYAARQIHAFANYSATPPLDSLVMIGSSAGFLGASNRDILVYTLDAAAFQIMSYTAGVVVGPGTIGTTSGSTAVTGAGTDFTLYAPGDIIVAAGVALTTRISSIASATAMTMTANSSATASVAYSIIPTWPLDTTVSFAAMNSLLWVCGQGRQTVKWNGTILANQSAFPQASHSIVFRNYMFAANISTNASRILWSALSDPTTWPASNFVDVSPDDGQPIVGLFISGNSIVILKTASAFLLTGDIFDPANPTYTLTAIPVPSDFLINSSGSVQLRGDQFIMLGQNGFYALVGGEIVLLPYSYDNSAQFLTNLNFKIGTAPASNAAPSSIMVDGNYWVSVESSSFSHTAGNKNVVLCLDKNNKLWRWNLSTVSQISDMAYRLGILYGVNYDPGNGANSGLQTLNTGFSDTGTTAINGTFTTKVFEYTNQQRFGVVYVYFKKQAAGNLTFEVSVDEGSFVSNTIDMTAGTGTRVKSAPIVVGRVGRSIQFRFSNNVAAQTFEIYAVELYRKELRR